jgi:N utilization substance protein A|tara:strand:- start:887 stop:1303 length:417 start_codon:yes stop_codon:yes gene_type:complete
VAKIKYDINIMKYMSLFESLTGARVKDCIVNDGIFFIVHENEMGKAIGKKGSNLKRVENTLKKKIKLAEFSSDLVQFVQNLIYPIKAKEIKEEEDGTVTIYIDDRKTKGMLIGRDRHNINSIADTVKRHFDVNEIKVV